jgi:hypothetical protein
MSEELKQRLEAAEGPSRELDLAICIALNTGRSTDPRNPGAKHYTASVDAAMSLIPPETWFELKGPRASINIPSPVPNFWSAWLDSYDHMNGTMGWGATAPLAICVAALKRRMEPRP